MFGDVGEAEELLLGLPLQLEGGGQQKGAGSALSHQHTGGGAHTQPTAVDRVLLVPLLAVFGDVGEADKPLSGLPVRLEGGGAHCERYYGRGSAPP